MTTPASIAIIAAMALVRYGWGGPSMAAWGGWALALAALLVLGVQDGAWGIAVGIVTGTLAALAIVLHAGLTSPAKARRPSREAPSIALPRRLPDLGRRLVVFVLVVPIAFAAAQWLAFGSQALARHAGAGDADTFVLTTMLQPIAWAALMSWQMTRADPSAMVLPPVAAALLGTVLWCAA